MDPQATVSNIFKDNEIGPAPERGERTTWSQFLKANWNVLAAADFFTVEVLRVLRDRACNTSHRHRWNHAQPK